jgi:cytochrome b6-f complex iron-sulfur subunit
MANPLQSRTLPAAEVPDDPSRRELGKKFFTAAATIYGVGLAWPVFRYLQSGATGADEGPQVSEVKLGPVKDVAAGSGKLFMFGSKPALLLRRPDGRFVALFATCTHLGCTVGYSKDHDRIECACHGGVYDPDTGKNIGGPPPAPLKPLVVSTDGDEIVVRRA